MLIILRFTLYKTCEFECSGTSLSSVQTCSNKFLNSKIEQQPATSSQCVVISELVAKGSCKGSYFHSPSLADPQIYSGSIKRDIWNLDPQRLLLWMPFRWPWHKKPHWNNDTQCVPPSALLLRCSTAIWSFAFEALQVTSVDSPMTLLMVPSQTISAFRKN